MLDEKLLQFEKVHTDENGSDMMTKSLSKEKHDFCRSKAGLMESPHLSREGEICWVSLLNGAQLSFIIKKGLLLKVHKT